MATVKNTYVLGIETSCDDTGLAIISNGEVVAFQKSSQGVHQNTNGVVPQIAAQEHLKEIDFLFEACLNDAKITMQKISAIGVTSGPGLIGSLAVGASWALGLSQNLNLPIYGINHLEGHVFTLFFSENKPTKFPILVLLASGGHTMLLDWDYPREFNQIFNTRDDSAGEALDKVATMLNLGFPGGPEIERHAKQAKGDHSYNFTVPMRNKTGFSFSGLKTEARKKINLDDKLNLADFCASFQKVAFDHLLDQSEKQLALKQYHGLAIVGGVSANQNLRNRFQSLAREHSLSFLAPPLRLSTDNGVMPAVVAEKMFNNEIQESPLKGIFSRFNFKQ
ncbi:tRNA (adenosine(37)-N6)-threonylcarbamoyltransferase complex transferase subunit TsaD [bacterium]|nr:tRNA (adenosine(37)-N6)-threonylcarbamoyltransferase complex transferase subunit TsaD [bacterium]